MSNFMYFKRSEFDCQETGENNMDDDFLKALDSLRHECGFPFVITSGYRSPNHSIEKRKQKPGKHSEGIAADVAVNNGEQRALIVQKALELGFKGIGVSKKFAHVDIRDVDVPVMWVY